jgi:YD repeat-containing protein
MESIAFTQNAVTTVPTLAAVNVPAKVIEFTYDGLSRRIRKKVTEGASTIAVWEDVAAKSPKRRFRLDFFI